MNLNAPPRLSHRFWRLLALTIFVLSLLRGIRYPNIWSYTHFLFNYDLGFVKRGLIGEILTHLGSPYFLTYKFFVIFSLVVFTINVILLSTLISEMVSGNNSVLIGSTLVFVSSLAVVFFAHTIGYLDHVGLLITLIALKTRHFYKKLGFLFLSLPIALLMHEAVLILLFPVIFMSLLLHMGKQNRLQKMVWLGVFSAVMLVLVFTISEHTLEQAEADEMYTTLQANVDHPLRRDAFNVLHRDSQENMKRTMERWAGDLLLELRQSLLVTAPSILLLIYITVITLRHAAVSPYVIVLAVLASLSPLLLHLWGWDMHRWNTFAITTSFLMLYTAQTIKEPPVKISTAVYFFFALLVFLNGISTIPLFDGYYVKQFPFIEHQNYLLDLLKGVQTFPYIPPR